MSASVLAVIGIIGLTAVNSVSAYQGDYTKQGPNCTEERHTAMETAINNNDYESWKKLMQGKGRVTQIINESNFSKFAEAYKLAKEGKYTEADAVRKELGLRTSNGEKTGNGFGNGQGMGHGRTIK